MPSPCLFLSQSGLRCTKSRKSGRATLTGIALLAGTLALLPACARLQGTDSAAGCPVLSDEADAFLEGFAHDMLDPESDFSYRNYIGKREMREVEKFDTALKQRDWGNLCKYRDANAAALNSARPEVVFIGDSITEFWSLADPELFNGRHLNRGISGQTSSQILLRFWQDAVSLGPQAVHIMAGTNDLAENTGYVSDEVYKANIKAMVTLAQANDISVILASIPPAGGFDWRPDLHPPDRIAALNLWLEEYASETGALFVDYHSLLSSDGREMSFDLTHDGIHPHRVGYMRMGKAVRLAIDAALKPDAE